MIDSIVMYVSHSSFPDKMKSPCRKLHRDSCGVIRRIYSWRYGLYVFTIVFFKSVRVKNHSLQSCFQGTGYGPGAA